jgi:hypothetical protein
MIHFHSIYILSRCVFVIAPISSPTYADLAFDSYRLTEPSGYIHDGLGNYSIGVKCSWLIDARGPYQPSSNSTASVKKKPKRIRLHLEEFATECSWDHLYIYDGDSVQSPLLAVFRLVNNCGLKLCHTHLLYNISITKETTCTYHNFPMKWD